MRVTDTFTFFWGGCFSNWHKHDFIHDAITFNCAEQALMYKKAMLFGDTVVAEKILKTKNPQEQKNLGRQVKGLNSLKWEASDIAHWEANCDEIMYRILFDKFKVPVLRTELLRHPDTYFVEASPKDKIWGIGMSEDDVGVEDPANWKGTNKLGAALNKVKEVVLDQILSIQNMSKKT